MTRAFALARFRRFGLSRSGSTALTFAVATPLLVLVSAIATDTVSWYNTKTRLQRAADSAALAAAKELTLASKDQSVVSTIAQRYVSAQLKGIDVDAEVTAKLIDSGRAVQVELARTVQPMLGRFYPEQPVRVIVRAIARSIGSANVCAVALATSDLGAIALRANSKITAPTCAIYSNSKNVAGLVAYDAAVAQTSLICSAGGYTKLGTPSLTPEPTRDCPALGDPLAGRPEPTVGACVATNKTINGGTQSLTPGTYCGGLRILGGATVTLMPGIYVFKDGPLSVDGGSKFSGQNVGLFFKDSGAGGLNAALLKFGRNSSIDISAPKDGAMAGMLMAEGASNRLAAHLITSNDARNLLGTIYLPNGILTIDASQPVAQQSAYTVIVAHNLKLEAGPNLYLNTNYGLTDIPVPNGVGPIGRVIRLGE